MSSINDASNLTQSLERIGRRAAAAVVARARLAHPGLNQVLLDRLSQLPGQPDSFLADPMYEAARDWKTAPITLGELSGNLLDPVLVKALNSATDYRMADTLRPFAHQFEAWTAALTGKKSVLVTSGTGSGKTECFMIPVLNDLLSRVRPGGGIQAILLYPLNALIESQRERLSAWAAGLNGRVRFALYNGETPETPFRAGPPSGQGEVNNRQDLRARPPEILVTNITMLEYLLLRSSDRPLLAASQGALRWIVLDEAHSYVGSAAAEMALLLRRVRAGFGVTPDQVQLLATSATIGGEADRVERLTRFLSDMAGQPEHCVTVIEGSEEPLPLPPHGPDLALDIPNLAVSSPERLWETLAPHPRVQTLRKHLLSSARSLGSIAQLLFNDCEKRVDAQLVLDAAARATSGKRHLLPWRAHLFHRAQGGVFACINPACPDRAPLLTDPAQGWPWGAIHLTARTRCGCGAAVHEVVGCESCGAPHLQAQLIGGAHPRLTPPRSEPVDDFALDAEPDDDDVAAPRLALIPVRASAAGLPAWISLAEGLVYDNAPPDGTECLAATLVEDPSLRACCEGAEKARLQPLRFGPSFLMGAVLPSTLEMMSQPMPQPENPTQRQPLPAAGRRAITFTDSRQGVARMAAKLQQDAERNLTRSFLLHTVQERSEPTADPAALKDTEAKLAKYRALDPEALADEIATLEARLAKLGAPPPAPVISWTDLVARMSRLDELQNFAGEVWRRRITTDWSPDDPNELARVFLLRELFRRPRVQNNAETMGFVQLLCPALDAALAHSPVPPALTARGVDAASWRALHYGALDTLFRNRLAVDIPAGMIKVISPRFGSLKSMVASDGDADDISATVHVRRWPKAGRAGTPGRATHLVRWLRMLVSGNPDDRLYSPEIETLLDIIWQNLTRHACNQAAGAGRWRMDFSRFAVKRVDEAWICPVSRRIHTNAIMGRSPEDIMHPMTITRLPQLPLAYAGGLRQQDRVVLQEWLDTEPVITALRTTGQWSNLHDRVVLYPSFQRAQEHSAQIPRPVLQTYEQQFNAGRINFLNCSTTMEMGVDLRAVQLVVNANLPPALANYRQRIGRAGRRRETWAWGLTFCRDLPLDRQAFSDPAAFLGRPGLSPQVWLDGIPLVQRHVNAALLGAWLDGSATIKGTTGAFMGADPSSLVPQADAAADRFIADLRGSWGRDPANTAQLASLVRGSALATVAPADLVRRTAEALERLCADWRNAFRNLQNLRDGTSNPDAKSALEAGIRRMAGEFFIGEMARRGFTPAYGFPTDVVSFELPQTGTAGRRNAPTAMGYSFRTDGPSRELARAIREYAPGAELVIDGQVWRSEGILPAWAAGADGSGLEDLRNLWECRSCGAFDSISGSLPEACSCGCQNLTFTRILRPTGFMTASDPHTGYENLAHSPWEPDRVSADTEPEWTSMTDPQAGRWRHAREGQVLCRSSGRLGGGFALCLCCGRAEPMEPAQNGMAAEIPAGIRRHRPLALRPATQLTHDGYCPGGYTEPHRVQRHVVLAHMMQTDVFELQLPDGTELSHGLAMAAALRDALAALLGIESRELGVSAGQRPGPSREPRISIWLHDRASGGAGLSGRLADHGVLATALEQAEKLLDCPEHCESGCPACILQPDLSVGEQLLDRPAALLLARDLRNGLVLPAVLQVFGPDTASLSQNGLAWLLRLANNGVLTRLRLPLHGSPDAWQLSDWAIQNLLTVLRSRGVAIELLIPHGTLNAKGLDASNVNSLIRLEQFAKISMLKEAPMAGGLRVIALVETARGTVGCAATSAEAALATEDWGTGQLLSGPLSAELGSQQVSMERLIALRTGNTWSLRPKEKLEWAVKDFGKRFWNWFGLERPLEWAAMNSIGIAEASYNDRYLVTPLNLALAGEILRQLPGGKDARLTIQLAARKPELVKGYAVTLQTNYEDDTMRSAVLQQLLPGATIRMAQHKNQIPHRRELSIILHDGRKYLLRFEKGMGNWYLPHGTTGIQHDTAKGAALQAEALMRCTACVSGDDDPIMFEHL